MGIYKSKIGAGIALILVVVLGLSTYAMVLEGAWLGLSIIGLVVIFTAYVFTQTLYHIEGNFLAVKCGFLLHRSFEISTIKTISETNNPVSAPAASLDRLEITMDDGKAVLVSPKQKAAFIEDLKRRNPNITIHLKTKKDAHRVGSQNKS